MWCSLKVYVVQSESFKARDMLSLKLIVLLAVSYNGLTAANVSVCFYTNWAQYRLGVAKFVPEDIDVSLCSHINYAFAKINLESHEIQEYEWNDDVMIGRVNALKQKKPSLKTIISVGKCFLFAFVIFAT